MGLRGVNDFRVGSILIDDAASFGVITRQLLIEILCNCAVRETGRYFNPLPKNARSVCNSERLYQLRQFLYV
jgi:hypothetical protein